MTVALVSLLLAAAVVDYVNAAPAPALVARQASQPVQPCWTTYRSLPGDTCDTIGLAFRIPVSDIRSSNSFLNCNDIWPNTPICIYAQSQVTVTGIPPAAPTTIPGSGECWTNYRSQPGDTCDRIASRFGITPAAVFNANTFLNCNDIWDGTPIAICDGNRTRTTVVNTTGVGSTLISTRTPTLTITIPTTSLPTISIPTISQSPIRCWTTYNTLPGETCETIAMAFRIPALDVAIVNPSIDCNNIAVNTNVCIFAPSQMTITGVPPAGPTTVPGSGTCWTNYRSQPGDTCDRIASRFGITPAAVYDANTFLNCNDIWDGTPITICDGNRTRTTVVNTTRFPSSAPTSTVIATAP